MNKRALPAGVTLGLHALAVAGLYLGFQPEAPQAAAPRVLHTTLVSLPKAPPPPLAQPAPPPPAPAPPAVEPPAPTPQPEQAQLAKRRVEQRQREEQQRRQREEQKRETEHQLALQQERQLREQESQARAERQHQADAASAAKAAAEALAAQDYQPLQKKAPAYPDSALDRRLEGDCTVEYTVTPSGAVSAPRVVAGHCAHSVFEGPSLRAAAQFRYQPRLVDGRAVAVANVRNTFHYRIREANR
ncbi:energy transducer TonB [Pseudomonas citronellolis]|uniref:energy transducer TonB n=1 Tax=Pseudomonas citronellolis TaxID=53408 RepID=UPI0023E449D1|nr:energy transducer TonB [Pseudomonas citronellolis]MDF3933883.1 energy transducer TonB [Pseudomonas citronellolis]